MKRIVIFFVLLTLLQISGGARNNENGLPRTDLVTDQGILTSIRSAYISRDGHQYSSITSDLVGNGYHIYVYPPDEKMTQFQFVRSIK